jgi:hypothetical protein
MTAVCLTKLHWITSTGPVISGPKLLQQFVVSVPHPPLKIGASVLEAYWNVFRQNRNLAQPGIRLKVSKKGNGVKINITSGRNIQNPIYDSQLQSQWGGQCTFPAMLQKQMPAYYHIKLRLKAQGNWQKFNNSYFQRVNERQEKVSL